MLYQVQDFQIVGGPAWLNTDRFDVIAKAEGDVPPPEPGGAPGKLQLMVRSLLADRLKLTVHHEGRELPMYALVVARSDGKLGPKLKVRDRLRRRHGGRARSRYAAPPPPQAGNRCRAACGWASVRWPAAVCRSRSLRARCPTSCSAPSKIGRS